MTKPVVAIIGRPNVGKSTLVNRIVGSRKAIVDDLPGVTRDRAYYDAEWQNAPFTLVDTGGLEPDESAMFSGQINEQVAVALAEAHVVIFVLDALTGITETDEAIARMLRPLKKPVILAINKVDKREQLGLTSEFYKLGLGDPIAVSAMHGTVGVGDMLDEVMDALKTTWGEVKPEEIPEKPPLRLAFVGRPNVGKSSLVNRLIGEERHIVSDVSGTTRDAIDSPFTWRENEFVLVDTAGIRRKTKVEYGVEMFSVDRALRAMKRADVTILVIDAVEGMTDQDKKIIEASNESGRGLVLVINKWDAVAKKHTGSTREYEKKLLAQVPHARFAPIVFTSAMTGQRVDKVLEWAMKVQENRERRISTSVLNQLLLEAYTLAPPPHLKNKQLKIYYGTQVSVAPPTFLLFVNNDTLMKETYKRYLENRLREAIELTGTPIIIALRNKNEKDLKA